MRKKTFHPRQIDAGKDNKKIAPGLKAPISTVGLLYF